MSDRTITQSRSDERVKEAWIYVWLQARVKIPRGIFVYLVMIKNQQFHRQIQNEKINELLCNTLCSLLCSVCYLLFPCLSFTSIPQFAIQTKWWSKRHGTLNVIIERHWHWHWHCFKKPKNDLLPTFSPDFTWNRQMYKKSKIYYT